MKQTCSIVLILLFLSCKTYRGAAGKYESVDPEFKSTLVLLQNGNFKYTSVLDSFCNGQVIGKYKIIGKLVKFTNDYKYTEEAHKKFVDSLNNLYGPNNVDIGFRDFDMSETDWTFYREGIKPNEKVITNCFVVGSKHKKILH